MSDSKLPPRPESHVARVLFLAATGITGASGWLKALNSHDSAATASFLIAAELAFGLGALACPRRK